MSHSNSNGLSSSVDDDVDVGNSSSLLHVLVVLVVVPPPPMTIGFNNDGENAVTADDDKQQIKADEIDTTLTMVLRDVLPIARDGKM